MNFNEKNPLFFISTLIVVLVAFFVTIQFVLPTSFYGGLLPGSPRDVENPALSAGENGSRTSGGCLITGCSAQICGEEEVITTCEYRDEYACYSNAKCGRQADGECGWTMDENVRECLAEINR